MEEAISDGNAKDVFLGKLRRALGESTNSGGTNARARQNILTKNGVNSVIKPTTAANLAQAIKENKAVIASVDAGRLWEDSAYNRNGHAIVVYDGEFDENGNITDVWINDTGEGKQGKKVPIAKFMEAARAHRGSALNIPTKESF
jgi:hypothetical protein